MAAEPFNTFVLAAPVASSVGGSDKVPIIQAGITKQASIDTINGAGLPKIVAELNLTDQSADYALTTLMTSDVDGLYRFQLFGEVTATDAGAGTLDAVWETTDDIGTVNPSVPMQSLAVGGRFTMAPQVRQCNASQPIQFSLTGGGTYGTARWSMRLVLEQLQ